MAMRDAIIPIFPLPSVVLFPNVFLPLHIFEPRYRQMVTDALSSDRLIGMTLLRGTDAPGHPDHPPVFQTGCVGVISHVERLADGRFNMVLRGTHKFRIVRELASNAQLLYRTVQMEALEEAVSEADIDPLAQARTELEHRLEPLFARARAESLLPHSMPDVDVINALAQYLDFEPLERQALLEQPGPLARCRALIELLDLRAVMEQQPLPGDLRTRH